MIGLFFANRLGHEFGHLPELFVVHSPVVAILKVDLFKLGRIDDHFASILKNNRVVEFVGGALGGLQGIHLDESLPDLGLDEDKYPHDLPIGSEDLVEHVVGDDIAAFVVDTNQKNAGVGPCGGVLVLHYQYIMNEC